MTIRGVALFLLIMSTPLNGILPILNIGELSRDGFFYASILYITAIMSAPSAWPKLVHVVKSTPEFLMVYVVVVLMSTLLNYFNIETNQYIDRSGWGRFVSSSAIFGYYFLLMKVILVHVRLDGYKKFYARAESAFIFLGVLLVLLSAFESLGWFFSPLAKILLAIRSSFVFDPEVSSFRLSGVSLEPSFNAFAMLSCMPFVYARRRTTGSRRSLLLLFGLVVCAVLSGSRTAYVGLFIFYAFLFVRNFTAGRSATSATIFLFTSLVFVAGLLLPLYAFDSIGGGTSVSNVTRSYLAAAAVEAGFDRIFGQGFGQVSFYVVQTIYSQLIYSWELRDYFYGARFGEFPPLFSWYARTLGEFGLLGYAVVAIAYARALRDNAAMSLRDARLEVGGAALLAYLLLGEFLAIGFSIDSVRVPQFWLAWTFMTIARTAVAETSPSEDQQR
ncbi:hypothetical protein [Rhizobium glycinendophyticum]|uniref:O-antigen ligase family protein n=1 Tax=Rhizobium glycinendophyticum TaxID=2589807 RepID=A0A504TP67_9HYPH|nr:hypothetical protein [Rhizobium glycinendophyticum]TPP03924.1 hypothetical protein FJQ55_22805 [Rhizobium glycinendophyticum]